MMPNKKNDINAMFDQMPMRDALVQMGMGGAMHSDEQWASIRDEFLESIAKGLNGVRAQARYQVAETMFRTDENE